MAANSNRDIYIDLLEQRNLVGGRFRDLKRIGATGGDGGFSIVFSAFDNTTKKRIALKFLDPDLQDPYRISCFNREAEILGQLAGQRDIIGFVAPLANHNEQFVATLPNGNKRTVAFLMPYYALELADSDVVSWLNGGPKKAHELLRAFRAMCRAVQRLHANDIVHRDLKLQNFLVVPSGETRLSDFGTARDLGQTQLAKDYSGFPVGDMRFCAPELLACLHDRNPGIAAGADCFSLGCILYELFSGVTLGTVIYDKAFVQQLVNTVGLVPEANRKYVYDGIVGNIRDSRPLPPLPPSGSIPKSIRWLLEDLYRQLAEIDYRRRLTKFEPIFLRLNRLDRILQHDVEIQRRRDAKCR